MKNLFQYCFILAFILLIITLVIIYYKSYSNSYVGINMGPCKFCHAFAGEHTHFICNNSEVSQKKYPNYVNNNIMCPFCKNEPNKMHMHFGSNASF